MQGGTINFEQKLLNQGAYISLLIVIYHYSQLVFALYAPCMKSTALHISRNDGAKQ